MTGNAIVLQQCPGAIMLVIVSTVTCVQLIIKWAMLLIIFPDIKYEIAWQKSEFVVVKGAKTFTGCPLCI